TEIVRTSASAADSCREPVRGLECNGVVSRRALAPAPQPPSLNPRRSTPVVQPATINHRRSAGQFPAMRFGEIAQGGEIEVAAGSAGDFAHRADPPVLTIDPAGSDAQLSCGYVIVHQALSDVQDAILLDPLALQASEHVFEVAYVGLVRADVFGGHD